MMIVIWAGQAIVITWVFVDVRRITYQVVVDCETCWGRLVGEDSQEESCRLCADCCPEVFEKPSRGACARTRPDVDPSRFLCRVRDAIGLCPTGSIELRLRGL
jgi:ferredoxin